MKSLLSLTALFALCFGISAAHANDFYFQSAPNDFPVQKNIETRQITATHLLNHPVAYMDLDTVIYFNNASSTLTPKEDAKLKLVANTLKAHAHRHCHVAVQGYTDNRGSDALNQRLSYHRAVQVMHILVKQYGVPASMLSAQGFGKENPVADNMTAEGRALNRRVTFSAMTMGN